MKKLTKFGFSSATRLELLLVLVLALLVPFTYLHARGVLGINTAVSRPNTTPTPTLTRPNPTPGPIAVVMWVGGYIYNDRNTNKDRDMNESGMPNQEVLLTEIGNDQFKTTTQPVKVYKVRTDGSGYFEFKIKPSATKVTSYSVQVSLPAGYTNTSPYSKKFNLGRDKNLVEFGISNAVVKNPTPTPPQTSKCTDSDGGKNYTLKGTTKGISPTTGELYTGSDVCYTGDSNGTYKKGDLVEHYCSGDYHTNLDYHCPYGCSNGACIAPPGNGSVTPTPPNPTPQPLTPTP